MRTAVLLAGVGFAFAVVTSAYAQHEEFAYTPENRWVYDGLNRMMGKGILIGFRAFRPGGDAHQAQTRIVFAMAVNAASLRLLAMDREIQLRIAALDETSEVKEVRAELEMLKEQERRFRGYDEDIRALMKLSRTFRKELGDLGVNTFTMRQELSELRSRTRAGWRAPFAKDDPRSDSKQKPIKGPWCAKVWQPDRRVAPMRGVLSFSLTLRVSSTILPWVVVRDGV